MQKTLVWDLPTRLFHWLIVASLLAQYATVEWLDNKVQWHFYIGYFTLFLVAFRVLWGFVGTQHARFSNFVTGPKKVFSYMKTLFNRQSEPAIGHNPLGGWFVIVMLVLLAIQAISGLFMTDDIFLDGPYRQLASEEILRLMNTLPSTCCFMLSHCTLGQLYSTAFIKNKSWSLPWCTATKK